VGQRPHGEGERGRRSATRLHPATPTKLHRDRGRSLGAKLARMAERSPGRRREGLVPSGGGARGAYEVGGPAHLFEEVYPRLLPGFDGVRAPADGTREALIEHGEKSYGDGFLEDVKVALRAQRGAPEGEADLHSYLLFDRCLTCRQVVLGREDARTQSDGILAVLGP